MVWVDGKPLEVQTVADSPSVAKKHEGATVYRAISKKPIARSAMAEIRMELTEGFHGGAALPEPVDFTCATGHIPLGEWNDLGLENYSGQMWYRKTVSLSSQQCSGKVMLDLGKVCCAARVFFNGKEAGTVIAPPYAVDITDYVKRGDNKLEVLVANTLGNYYMSFGYPNSFVGAGQDVAGLIGPVKLECMPQVALKAAEQSAFDTQKETRVDTGGRP